MTQKLQFSGSHPLFPENIIMKNVPKRKYNQGVCLNYFLKILFKSQPYMGQYLLLLWAQNWGTKAKINNL